MARVHNKLNRLGAMLSDLYFKTDLLQLFAMLSLLTVGILFIYGTGQQVGTRLAMGFWIKQLQWVGVGFCCWLLLSIMDYRHLRYAAPLFYLLVLGLLVLVLVAGIKVYGATRWLDLKVMRLQPSEFAKLSVTLTLGWVMTMKWFNINRLWGIGIVLVIMIIPFLLIIRQPDLGTAVVLIPIACLMVFISNLKWKYMLIGLGLCMSLAGAEGLNEYYQVMPLLKPYQRQRIEVFLHPEKDVNNRGWNQLQSKLAVGSGGASGKGFMQGDQNQLGFLPQTVSNTDFIFSVIAEETGFAGVSMVIFLYTLLILSIMRAAWLSRDAFGRYVAAGIGAMVFMHAFVNMGMSIGVMPITGLPLPLVSYGGSFMLSMMINLGIVQSIYARRLRPGERRLSSL